MFVLLKAYEGDFAIPSLSLTAGVSLFCFWLSADCLLSTWLMAKLHSALASLGLVSFSFAPGTLVYTVKSKFEIDPTGSRAHRLPCLFSFFRLIRSALNLSS